MSSSPAVVANLTENANTPGVEASFHTPASPTTATEATGRSGNQPKFRIRIRTFEHRGYRMVEDQEWDDDGFATPAYFAWKPALVGEGYGDTFSLNHSRFDFVPTQNWFEREVDRVLAHQRAKRAAANRALAVEVIGCTTLIGCFAVLANLFAVAFS